MPGLKLWELGKRREPALGLLGPLRGAPATQCRYGLAASHPGYSTVRGSEESPLRDHRDAIGQSVTSVTYGMLIIGQETGN
jgi:hypothetical protein